MSYNSYLLLADRPAILDSVEHSLCRRWIANIEAALPAGTEPAYLVVHHMEPDHSGSLAFAMRRWSRMRIVTSAKAAAMIPAFFPDCDFIDRIDTVAEGHTLSLGSASLRFFAAPMVHWPEVLVSYLESEKMLFSADAFGKFGALQYADDWAPEAQRYYINIVGKYGTQVQSLLKKLAACAIEAVAPLHGPVLRGEDLSRALSLYESWSSYTPVSRGVLVAYASIYGGTARAAVALADELRRIPAAGEVYLADLTAGPLSDAVARAFQFDTLVIASPTYDASLFPVVHDFIHHLSLKNFRNRRVALIENGSWAPVAARLMRRMLEHMPEITFPAPDITVRSAPDAATFRAIAQMAQILAHRP